MTRALTLNHGGTPMKAPIPVHAAIPTKNEILRMFPYLEDSRHSRGQGVPPFQWHGFNYVDPFQVPSCGNLEVIPLAVWHGKDHSPEPQKYINVGFRIGDFSYIGDVNVVPDLTKEKVEGTRFLVLNALRDTLQSAHFSFTEVLPIL